MFVIQFVALALGGRSNIKVGDYLMRADPDAFEGRGLAEWTSNLADAMKFDSFAAATEVWKAQSTKQPLRRDGKPNRPLTAYTVEITRV